MQRMAMAVVCALTLLGSSAMAAKRNAHEAQRCDVDRKAGSSSLNGGDASFVASGGANAASLQARIRELEKEVAKLHGQIKTQQYGLVWLDVPEAFDKDSENALPILEEVKDKAIKNDDGKSTHILIEGDNYHALTCLNYTHREKVDVIYIDPPYNTGSDGFSYKDKRTLDKYPDGTEVPKNHPLRHSYWLSFIEKRLSLAKNLLKNDGAIFISINEEEYANLKLLCDKVFYNPAHDNYVTTFTIKVRHEDRILKGDKPIHETTEFLLMYQKSNAFRIHKRQRDNTDPSEYCYQIQELIKDPSTIKLGGKDVKVFKPGQYKIVKQEPDFKNLKKINIRGSIKTGNSSGRFHMSYLEERNNEFSVLYRVPGIGDDGLGYRYFLTRKDARGRNGFYFQGCPVNREDVQEIPYPNFFDFEAEFNGVGTEGGVVFDGGKKPIEFIKKILAIAKGDENIVVLDFFAGSGSTAHAIASRNIPDGMSQCIMVQSPELTYTVKDGKEMPKPYCKQIYNAGIKNIAQITHKRCVNVFNGYRLPNGEKVEGLGGSLKYYRTAFVGKNAADKVTDEDRAQLAHKAGCLLALGENTLEECGIRVSGEGSGKSAKSTVKKSPRCYQLFTDGKDRMTGVYFSEDVGEMGEFVAKLEAFRDASRLNRVAAYFFSWDDGGDFSNEFGSMRRIAIKTIPAPILEVYRTLNGERGK